MIEVGSKVRFTNKTLCMINPEFYPQPGTVGVVERINRDFEGKIWGYIVKWPIGSWCASAKDLEEAENG